MSISSFRSSGLMFFNAAEVDKGVSIKLGCSYASSPASQNPNGNFPASKSYIDDDMLITDGGYEVYLMHLTDAHVVEGGATLTL